MALFTNLICIFKLHVVIIVTTVFTFKWTPVPPPKKKRRKITRNAESMMAGFGSRADVIEEPNPEDAEGIDFCLMFCAIWILIVWES